MAPRIPAPSRDAQMALHRVILCCRQQQPHDAATELNASARASIVIPSMLTDYYHYANAAIKLNLAAKITAAALSHVIAIIRSEPIYLSGQRWICALYDQTIDTDDDNYEERYDALKWVDLDHFADDHLTRLVMVLVPEGQRLYQAHRPHDALDCFRKAHRLAAHLERKDMVGVCLFEIGFALHSSQQSDFAEAHYSDAIGALTEYGKEGHQTLGRYLFHVSRFYELAHDNKKKQRYLERALIYLRKSSDSEGVKLCEERLLCIRR